MKFSGKSEWEKYFDAVKKSDWASARASLQKISAAEKNNPQVFLKLGDVYQRLGSTQEAIKAYHESAGILKAEGFHHKAAALYKIILRLVPDDEAALEKSREIIAEIESDRSEDAAVSHPYAHPEQESRPAFEYAFAGSEPKQPEDGFPAFSAGDLSPKDGKLSGRQFTDFPPAVEPGKAPSGESTDSGFADFQEIDFTPRESGAELQEADSGATVRVPELFSSYSADEYLEMLGTLEIKSYSNGERVVEEGDSGDAMYMIKTGRAKVVAHLLGREIELAELGAGDFFGEVAFLTGRPRTASVTASGPLSVYEISRLEVENIIEKNPEILARIEMFHESRVQETIKKVLPK